MKALIFDKTEWEKLKAVCERGYPKEVCGLLFGKPGGNGNAEDNKVVKIEALENVLDGKHSLRLEELMKVGAVSINAERAGKGGYFEFLIDPREHYEKTAKASAEGLDQIGVFHSHPDHPAVPSPTDASQPYLAGWSNIIVAVHRGKFNEARSWTREKEDSSFQEEKILVE